MTTCGYATIGQNPQTRRPTAPAPARNVREPVATAHLGDQLGDRRGCVLRWNRRYRAGVRRFEAQRRRRFGTGRFSRGPAGRFSRGPAGRFGRGPAGRFGRGPAGRFSRGPKRAARGRARTRDRGPPPVRRGGVRAGGGVGAGGIGAGGIGAGGARAALAVAALPHRVAGLARSRPRTRRRGLPEPRHSRGATTDHPTDGHLRTVGFPAGSPGAAIAGGASTSDCGAHPRTPRPVGSGTAERPGPVPARSTCPDSTTGCPAQTRSPSGGAGTATRGIPCGTA